MFNREEANEAVWEGAVRSGWLGAYLRMTLSPSLTVMLSGRCPNSAPPVLRPAEDEKQQQSQSETLKVLTRASSRCRGWGVSCHFLGC